MIPPTHERLAEIEQWAETLMPLEKLAVRELLAALLREAEQASWKKDAEYFRSECDRLRGERDALQQRVMECSHLWKDGWCFLCGLGWATWSSAEIARLRAEVERLTRERVAIQNDDRILTCVFCGLAYPPGTPTSNHQALTEHVAVCEKHPAAEFRKRADKAESRLAQARALVETFDPHWWQTAKEEILRALEEPQ